MCPDFPNDELVQMRARSLRSETGSPNSDGLTGGPSPLEERGARLVRHHRGLFDISVGSLLIENLVPGTFVALRRGALDVYMVTLSFALTNTRYGEIISRLESTSGVAGENVTVGVTFEPTTPNLVPPTTAPST